MDAIRVQNLRSLEDTGWVDLKPLTLLIGKNSSGKSTFLRCFPLFRQSIESRIVGPILWAGNYDRQVDFGSFQESVSYQNNGNEINFSFQFNSILANQQLFNPKSINKERKFEIELHIYEKTQTNQITNLVVKFETDHVINIKFDYEKIISLVINNQDFTEQIQTENYHKPVGYFIPTIYSKLLKGLDQQPFGVDVIISKYFHIYLENNLGIKNFDLGNFIAFFAKWFVPNSSQEMFNNFTSISNPPSDWTTLTKEWSLDSEGFKTLCNLILFTYISNIFTTCNQQLAKFAENVVYVAPIRATAQRYYTIQNLEIDVIDPRGENLATILTNLKPSLLNEFNNWLQKQFGFELKLEAGFGHISIKLKDTVSEKFYNMADTGFGFSQILPIVTQLWMLIYLPSNKNIEPPAPIFFAIEQPELHLHPELQAQLAQAFVIAIKEAKAQNRDLRLIIETHSETIINQLGQLIYDKKADNDDINVVVFDKRYPDEPTKVTFSHYNEEGYLVNWPWGFFEPEGLA